MPKEINIRKIAQLTGHKAAVYGLANYHSPSHFLSAAGEGWIVDWDLKNPEQGKLLVKVEGNIFSLLYLPEQDWLVAGDMHGGLHWIDVAKNENFRSVQVHQKGVFALRQMGPYLLSLGGEGGLSRWDITTARSLETLQLSASRLRGMAYHEQRNELAVASSDSNIYLLDAGSWTIKQVIEQAHENSVFCLEYSPDGLYLLSGGRDAHLRVWDIEQGFEDLAQQAAHLFTVNALAFDPSGELLATASRDKTIKIWDSQTYQLLKVLDLQKYGGHLNSVNNLLWSTYNNYLISCSDDRSIIVWEVEAS